MKMHTGLVLLLCLSTKWFVLTKAVDNNSLGLHYPSTKKNSIIMDNSKQQNQLIIYDPKSGKEMNPIDYLPIVVGNKRKPTNPNGNLVELPQLWNPCSCGEFRCVCCLGIRFGDAFNNRICTTIQYYPAESSISLRINYNSRTIVQFVFSARNPPDYCVPILMPLPIAICVRLYDIRAIGRNLQVCISLMLNIFMNTAFEYQFNCIQFGANGLQFNKPGQLEMDNSLENEQDDDEFILKGDEEIRQNVELGDDYSGISVEGERSMGVPVVRGKRGRK